jgi:hypothetical protein
MNKIKGRDTFTEQEAKRICMLIEQKLLADKKEQKRIRAEIRAIGFYISDFSSKKKYTTEDFKQAVKIK